MTGPHCLLRCNDGLGMKDAILGDPGALRDAYIDLQKKVEILSRELSESLEQQTATSEVLSVIGQSHTDVQPVFDAVAESAARLCESFDSAVWRREDNRLLLVAHHGAISQTGTESLPLVRGTVGGRSVLDGRTVHIADIQTEGDEFPNTSENARRQGYRTILSVPLMREGVAIGAIVLRRTEARLFSERQIALLQTFADQAVIAIENVRLFEAEQARTRELTESLQQQTATADVLKVISRSAFDLQTVLNTLVESAARLCDADSASVHRPREDGYQCIASYGYSPDFQEYLRDHPITPGRGSVLGRVVNEGKIVHVPDVLADPEHALVEQRKIGGYRTVLGVPLMREGSVIGLIRLTRNKVLPFTDKQVELVATFADQAVIAIENTRLLNELRGIDWQQQTATADVLKVISRSTFDLQTVLDTLTGSAAHLCEADMGAIAHLKGGAYYLVSVYGYPPDIIEYVKTVPHRARTRKRRRTNGAGSKDCSCGRCPGGPGLYEFGPAAKAWFSDCPWSSLTT